MVATPPAIDRNAMAANALAYYDSASPATICRNDNMSGEKYSVLDAASSLAAALRLFLDGQPAEPDARALLAQLGIDYREGIDDQGEPSFHLYDQHIAREDEEGDDDE